MGIGTSVTFTATVSGAGGGPTGTVTFYNGTASMGTGTLANGVATLTTSFSTTGTFTITAVYGGDTSYTGSTSQPLAETIASPGFTTTGNPSNLSIEFAGTGPVTVLINTRKAHSLRHVLWNSAEVFLLYLRFVGHQGLNSSGAAVSNTLTINSAAVPSTTMAAAFWLPTFAGLLALGRRKRRLALFCVCFAFIAALGGCGGRGDHDAPLGNLSVPVVVSSQGAASQTANVAATVYSSVKEYVWFFSLARCYRKNPGLKSETWATHSCIYGCSSFDF